MTKMALFSIRALIVFFWAIVMAFTIAGAGVADSGIGSRVGGLLKHDHSSDAKGGTVLAPVAPTAGNAAQVTLTANGQTRPSLALRGLRTGSTNYAAIYGGATNDGTNNIASSSTASLLVINEPATGDLIWYANTGLAEGGTFSFTERGRFRADGTISTSKACAAGYTRMSPNLCIASAYSSTSLATDSCTTVARPSADAKALLIFMFAEARAVNAAGVQRFSSVSAYTAANCATRLRFLAYASGYEHTAVTGGTILGADQNQVTVPVDGSGNVYMMKSDDAGNTGGAFYMIAGYID